MTGTEPKFPPESPLTPGGYTDRAITATIEAVRAEPDLGDWISRVLATAFAELDERAELQAISQLEIVTDDEREPMRVVRKPGLPTRAAAEEWIARHEG